MNERAKLAALSDEFRARAVQATLERYSREANYLNDEQLEARYQQLVVSHRRMLRELGEERSSGTRVPAWKQLAVEEMYAQKEAFEKERFVRSAARQMAAV